MTNHLRLSGLYERLLLLWIMGRISHFTLWNLLMKVLNVLPLETTWLLSTHKNCWDAPSSWTLRRMARGSVPTLSNAFPTTSPTSAIQKIMSSFEFPSMRTNTRRPSHTMSCWTLSRRIKNGLDLWATDIGNAYLEAKTSELLFIIASPEFGDLEGHMLIIYKALYGLCSSGLHWHECFSTCLRDMGFFPCKAEPDIWMRCVNNHYEYIAMYVDDLA
jgi:hypothetical protein